MEQKTSRRKLVSVILINLGLLIIVCATAMPLLRMSYLGDTFRYVYAAGALMAIVGRFMTPRAEMEGVELRVKRMMRLEIWSTVFFAVAVFFMFWQKTSTDWIAFTMAGGFLQAYTSIMIPRASRSKKP